MDLQLTAKRALVTGSTAGIGSLCSPPVGATNGSAVRVEGGIVRSLV